MIGIVWKWTAQGPGFNNSLHAATPLILVVVGLTGLYYASRFAWKNYLAQARFQFFFDVLLVTWLVWITGNANSPYAALYIVIISVASLFRRAARRDDYFDRVCRRFNGCALLALSRGTAGFSSEAIANTIQFVGLSDVSFLVVGLLAAKLAHRQTRSDLQLEAATRSLADLRALHERIVESIRSGVVTT
jgi:two-component system sensor histidine kinase PilS (NtrC family)